MHKKIHSRFKSSQYANYFSSKKKKTREEIRQRLIYLITSVYLKIHTPTAAQKDIFSQQNVEGKHTER